MFRFMGGSFEDLGMFLEGGRGWVKSCRYFGGGEDFRNYIVVIVLVCRKIKIVNMRGGRNYRK